MATPTDIQHDSYDRNMIPAEIAARRDREGDSYKQLPEHDGNGTDTTGGYTVDERGLANNYAIEPEMYVDEPGDLRAQNTAMDNQRAQHLKAIRNQDSDGLLDEDSDDHRRGPGMF